MKHDLTIATAWSSNHHRCGNNLLWSIAEREPRARVIIYDIVLTDEERDFLPAYVKHGELRRFDFSKYPAHFKLSENSGRMAFRPVIVHEASKEFGGIILWLDAGCILTGSLKLLMLAVKKYGIISPSVPSKLKLALHPSTHEALKVSGDRMEKPMRDAGISCFDTSQPKVMQFIEHWRDVALNPALTAPEGSVKRTHRQDAVFAALLLEHGFEPPHLPRLPIMSHQDHVDLKHLKLFFSRPWFLKPESEWPKQPLSVTPQNRRGYSIAIKMAARQMIQPKISKESKAIPFEKWPDYVREIAAQKIEGEIGVGTTVERVIGRFGSNEFREWYAEKAGVMKGQCHCDKWKPQWNAQYQYEKL